jgi:hypothetical protein
MNPLSLNPVPLELSVGAAVVIAWAALIVCALAARRNRRRIVGGGDWGRRNGRLPWRE